MSKVTNASTRGVGFLTLLGLLFIGLKLANVITWSWWSVLLPLYGGWALLFIILLMVLFIGALATVFRN